MPDSKQTRKSVYDKRTVGWYIENGRFEQKNYDNYLENLTDSASKAVSVEVEQPRRKDEEESAAKE